MVGIDPAPDTMVSKHPIKHREKIQSSAKYQDRTVRDKSARKSMVKENAETWLWKGNCGSPKSKSVIVHPTIHNTKTKC